MSFLPWLDNSDGFPVERLTRPRYGQPIGLRANEDDEVYDADGFVRACDLFLMPKN
jgi:hypothetical protein